MMPPNSSPGWPTATICRQPGSTFRPTLTFCARILGFRLGKRRTLAEMSPFGFVAAVAVGAIVGRVPNASTTSYFAGSVTLVTILVAHGCIARLRYFPSIAHLVDRAPRLLVEPRKSR